MEANKGVHLGLMSVFLWSLSFPLLHDDPDVITAICTLAVSVLVLLTCIHVSVCIWPCVWRACSCFISLSAPTCTVTCASSPLFCLSAMLRSLEQELAGSLCHLLHWRGKQTVRCTNTGSAAFLMQAPAGSLSVSSILYSRRVPSTVSDHTLALCSCTALSEYWCNVMHK